LLAELTKNEEKIFIGLAPGERLIESKKYIILSLLGKRPWAP